MRGFKKCDEVEVRVLENPRRLEVITNGCMSLLKVQCQRIIIHNPLASDRYSEGGAGEYINNSRYE
jgi:hypothetical protein